MPETANHRHDEYILRPDCAMRGHRITAPLDHSDPDGRTVEVFAREVVALEKKDDDLPWLVYLQGGPGGRSPRPATVGGWLGEALKSYRVLLLDQRGTGLSTPATAQTLAHLSAQEQAEYLTHFRADSIVRDAELFRQALGVDTWTTYGQSFGGFCTLTYLSLFPGSLERCLVTGGLAPLHGGPDPVYRRTFGRMARRNREYFSRYPEDQAVLNRLRDHLAAHDVRLPDGGRLTPERLQMLGMFLGGNGRFDALHFLLEDAFVEVDGSEVVSEQFLHAIQPELSFATMPLYAVLHESIYCQREASRWSAARVRDEVARDGLPGLLPGEELSGDFTPEAADLRLTGEMIYPWLFDQDAALRPLKEAADLLADKQDWGPLYDLEVLRANTVPVAAAVYADDVYVDQDLSLETARTLGGCRHWLTNEHHHDGIAMDGAGIFARLLGMTRY